MLPPRFPNPLAPPSQGLSLAEFTEWSGLRLDGVNLANQEAPHVTLHGVLAKRCRLEGSKLPLPRLTDVRFETCNLANATWERLMGQRVEFVDCQLVGFNALEAHLQNILFKGCQAQFIKLRFARFKQVRFENCDLRNADFQGSDLSGVVFHRCNLSDAELSATTLKGADLRGSIIERIHVGARELPGAIVDPFQAAYIAGLLGVVIRNEDE